MLRQAGGHFRSEEDESLTVVVNACQLDHAVVVVEQLRGQLSAADEDYDQVFVP